MMAAASQITLSVRLGEPVWRAVGQRRLSLRLSVPHTVAHALEELTARYPSVQEEFKGDTYTRYQLFVNARPVSWSHTDSYKVKEGDTLYIFPPAAGGREYPPLPRAFYDRDTLLVARELLGTYLVRTYEGHLLVGRIVETEAYIGLEDTASHAAVGKTERNAVMFGPPGHAYVYLIYGMHHCLNVVTEAPGFPAAVLIRAVEPVEGIDIMQKRRHNRPLRELTNGPGKLCQAMAIDRQLNGHDLCLGERLWIAPGTPVPQEAVVTGTRVGIRGDSRALSAPWRFAIRHNPFVSRPYPWRRNRQ